MTDNPNPNTLDRIGIATLVLVSMGLTLSHWPICSTNHLWGDESIVLWIWNQPFLSIRFFQSVTSNTAAPPGDFLIGAFFWRILDGIAPLWASQNLELSTRLYPMFIMGLTTFFLGWGLWEMTQSWLIALSLTLVFTKLSPEINYYFCEVRFYPALYLFSTVCWFAYLRLEKVLDHEKILPNYAAAYLIICAIAPWFHVYCLITIIATLIALAIRIPYRQLQNLAKTRIIKKTLSGVLASSCVWAYYAYKFHGNKPRVSLSNLISISNLARLWHRWLEILNCLFPRFSALLVVLIICSTLIAATTKTKRGQTRVIIFPIVLIASMIQNILHDLVGHTWEPRYVLYVLPSFFFAWGHVLGALKEFTFPFFIQLLGLRKPSWAKPWVKHLSLPVATLILFFLVSLKSRKTIQPGGDPWIRMRRQIVHDHLNVTGVIGIQPSPYGLVPENGSYVAGSWLLYIKGIKGLPWAQDNGEERLFWKADRWIDRHLPFTRLVWPRHQQNYTEPFLFPCRQSNRFIEVHSGTPLQEPVFVNYCSDPIIVRRRPSLHTTP